MNDIKTLIALIACLALGACGKEFLEVKRSKSQAVPAEISDFQGILDNWREMNSSSSHRLGIVGADEYYVADNHWRALSDPYEKNGYIWADDVYEGKEVDDWNAAYYRILLANMVLEGTDNIQPSPAEQEAWDKVRGSALFFRAWNHYQLAQLFCKPYDPATASEDMGIPLRLQTDVTRSVGRGTVEATYSQIVQDLKEAAELLPVESLNKMQPSRPAACALLARALLNMGDYAQAGEYAGMCLSLRDELVDFNRLDLTTNQLFVSDYGASNPEVLFFCFAASGTITGNSRFHADSVLLDMYAPGDHRLSGYFRDIGGGRQVFKGSYQGGTSFFTGLATDEVYLIAAECQVRNGNIPDARNYLNTLLEHRYDASLFSPVSTGDRGQLLRIILDERHRELVLRGLRWEDLRRLNKEPEYATSVVREVMATRYELPPGSPRWVWPIPDNEVDLADIPQNDR